MQDLNYRHLRYFQQVAHEGNLSKAAKRLHLSQSALSVQIRQLEERLGQPLFERRGRGLHLTEAGRIALDHADSIFTMGEELLATLRQTGQVRRPVRIGAIATLSRNFQLEFLKPLIGRQDVELVLGSASSAELIDGLLTLRFDLVLSNQEPSTDETSPLITRCLAEQSISLVGSPTLCRQPMDLAEQLASAPLLLPTRSSSLRRGIDALVGRLGIVPRIAAEIDDMAMLRLLAREGAGLAVLPPIVVQDELTSGRIVELHQLPDLSERFHALTIRRRFPNPLVQELLARYPETSRL